MQPGHILLIEPDAILARTYRVLLEYSGYIVDHVYDAQTAIDTADRHTPILVIMELLLLGHNGISFLHEFRSYKEWQIVPVVVLSRLNSDRIRQIQPVLERDFDVHVCLYKPQVNLAHILDVVRKELDRAGACDR